MFSGRDHFIRASDTFVGNNFRRTWKPELRSVKQESSYMPQARALNRAFVREKSVPARINRDVTFFPFRSGIKKWKIANSDMPRGVLGASHGPERWSVTMWLVLRGWFDAPIST